jgi:hypothetical protein
MFGDIELKPPLHPHYITLPRSGQATVSLVIKQYLDPTSTRTVYGQIKLKSGLSIALSRQKNSIK